MKGKLILSLIIVMFALIIEQTSYAAVEIVPSKSGDGKDSFVNIRLTESYLQCLQMKETGGSLKGVGSNVEPHLATNKDWGAVSYLANSIYGTNSYAAQNNHGQEVTINSVKYWSTTPNITGVMNWGSNPNINRYTQISTFIKGYMQQDENTRKQSSVYSNIEELDKAAKNNSKFVEIIETKSNGNRFIDSTLGMGIIETANYKAEWKFGGTSNDYPSGVREGFWGYSIGCMVGDHWNHAPSGVAVSNITFRPVIWN